MSVVKAYLRRLGIWFFLCVELWKYIQQNSLLPQGHCPCLNTFSYLLPKWDQKIKTCWQNHLPSPSPPPYPFMAMLYRNTLEGGRTFSIRTVED